MLAAAFLLPGAVQASAPTIADIVEVTDISGLVASPDGRSVAFRTERASIHRNSYELRWHVADVEPGRVREVGGGGAPIYVDPGLVQTEPGYWSPDNRFIFYRALADGAIGVWRAAADGAGSRPVILEGADVEALRPAEDGNSLLLVLGPGREEIRIAEEREYHFGILVDRHVDLAQNLFRGASINGRMATQRLTGRWFTRGGLMWNAPRRQRRLDLASLNLSDVPDAWAGSSSQLGLTARSTYGDAAAVLQQDGSSRVAVRHPDRADAELFCARTCRARRIVALAWRPGRPELLLTMQDEHLAQSLHAWNVERGSVRLVTTGDGLLGGGRDARAPCALTERMAVCVTAGPISPPRLERIDLDSGRRTILFDPNQLLRQQEWPRSERLSWSSPDGQQFHGILLLPPGRRGAPLPLLVNYYRCEGFLRGGVGDELPFAPLAMAQVAVLCINAASFSGPHRAASTYETALLGVRSAIDLLAGRAIIDRSRVGMGGLSFGSEATMWTAMHSDLLAAASIASIQFEPTYYWFNAVRGRDHPEIIRQSWGLGSPDQTPEEWRRMSPALNAERIRAPLLMQLPEQEARYVPELYARLTHSPTPVELFVFPEEAHIKIQPRHKLAAYRRNFDWFRFWLQGHVSADPASADQYRRWRELAARRSAASTSAPGAEPQLEGR